MNDRSKGVAAWWTMGVAVMLAVVSVAAGDAYLHEDAKIRGKEIHSFVDAGEQVSVVLGSFSLTLGKYSVTGRDAVLWVRSRATGGGLSLHDITVYVEGNARVVEPGGQTTSDRVMLVTVRSRGRLTASGTLSGRPLKDFPLYRRAVASRRASRRPAEDRTPTPQPPVSVTTQPVRKPAAPAAKPAPDRPIKVTRPPAPPRVTTVNFHARKFSSQEVGTGKDKRRVTIARGNVYLSQGSATSDDFLELRSQAAVVFSQAVEPADTTVPWAPKVQGMKLPGGREETISGVYLEGDVVIARGERYLRGPSAYYDFTTHRAVMVDPVFRTVQEQRNIPVYVRASEARALSERELVFKNARISTSDFYTPSYHIQAKRAYLKNVTPYDAKGVRLGENRWLTEVEHATFRVRDVPVAYWPKSRSDFTEGHSALRKAQVGRHGELGFGGETEWHLFRLLGLLEPEGFKGTLDLSWYDRGPFAGASVDYDRETFSGYWKAYGLIDRTGNDDFGEERKNIAAPDQRGRLLVRHKQFLPRDWQLQFELSYLCDENYLEQFFPGEFHGGKEQETLIYAKKQRDSWAFTTLLKYRLNRFQEQAEAAPEVGFHLIGQPLLKDRLTFFSESRAGALRHRIPKRVSSTHGSFLARLDTRNEIDWPLHVGPVNVVPYAAGRATYWSDRPEVGDVDYFLDENGKRCRLYGQVGVRTNMHIWRVNRDVQSRLWDLHGLKHVITPEAVAFLGESAHGVEPGHLYPMDADVEQHLRRQSGVGLGVTQRWQTKRGPANNRQIVDWMRLAILMGVYDNGPDTMPADGRFFFSRPEYSLGRNHVNADYTWNISDATTFLADGNFDMTTGRIRRWNLGLAVSREPRLRYYLGTRTIMDLDSSIATAGVTYKINRKYSVSFFQQIDMDYDGHESMASSITLLRKFPRWYVGATFVMDHTTDNIGLYLTLWPEGVPEFRIGSGRTALLAESNLN